MKTPINKVSAFLKRAVNLMVVSFTSFSKRRKVVKDKQYLLTQMRIIAHVTHKNISVPSLRDKQIYHSFYLRLVDILDKLNKLNLDSETYGWAKQICSEYGRMYDKRV